MRHWLILVMVLMLPLRGWAGDLMSVQMAVADASARSVAAMPADCPMHAEASAATDGESSAHTGGSMPTCSSCALCLPMAELATAVSAALGFAVHERPVMAQAAFVDAALAPAVEPPIS